MAGKKKTKLEKTIFDAEFDEVRKERRLEDDVDNKLQSEELRKCYDILMAHIENPLAAAFLEPVNWVALDLPTYPTIVKHPMDLSTVKDRLLTGQISTPNKFAELVRLVYKNATKFNQAGSHIHDIATSLLEEFDATFDLVKPEKVVHAPVYVEAPPPQVNPYAELEARVTEMEAKLAEVQKEAATMKANYATQAEEQALKVQPHLRMLSFTVLYPRRPFTPAEKEALCQRIASLEDHSIIAGLLEIINVHQDQETEVELDFESFDDDTLHKVADYLEEIESQPNPRSRYSYDDDGDYVLEPKKKKHR